MTIPNTAVNLFVVVAVLFASGCVRNQRQTVGADRIETRLEVLQDEVYRLQRSLQGYEEELRILTNVLGASRSELLPKAMAASEMAYPLHEKKQDLMHVKKSLERSITATRAELRVWRFPLQVMTDSSSSNQ